MSASAIARVDAAEAAGRKVERRVCNACGATQGRIQAKDGKYKRWSKCDCSKSVVGVAAGSQPTGRNPDRPSPEDKLKALVDALVEHGQRSKPDLPRDVVRLDKKPAK